MNNPFISQLKLNPTSYYFWSKIGQYYNQTKIYLGVMNINNNSDYSILIEQLLNDLLFKCQDQLCYIKLFHDIDNQQNLFHFLLIIDISQEPQFNKTLLYAVSKLTSIEQNIVNYKDKVNHYFEYIDLYHYQRIQSYQV